MAEKPSKEEDNRKDGDDEADQEEMLEIEYSDTEHLLEAGDKKKSKEELSAGTSKPSTPKKGDKSGSAVGKFHFFKRSEKEAKHGKAEDKPSPSKKTARKTSIVGSEVRTTFGTFCEYSELKQDLAFFDTEPEKCAELSRVASGGTIQSFLSEDDSSVTSEPYVSSRRTTGVVYQTVVREGGEERIDQKVVPLVELPQYPLVEVGTGLLAATSGLLAASVSIPALASDESSVVATGGAIPKEIKSSGEKLELREGASPAKRSKKAILSPELVDEKLQKTSGFQGLESTKSDSPIPMSPKLQGLESGGSVSSVQSPQVTLESIHIEPDSPFEIADPTCSKDEESAQAEPKDEKESEQTDPKVGKKSKE